MKTIRIGCYGHNKNKDRVVQYDHVVHKRQPGSKTVRPQFCTELTGGDAVVQIYAASRESHRRVKKFVAAENPDKRIAPSLDVLGVNIHMPPTGWPNEAEGQVLVRRAPNRIIDDSLASLPDKPVKKYPFRTTPGIEVIGLGTTELIKFMPYHPNDDIFVIDREVCMTFRNTIQEVLGLHVITVDSGVARKLAASLRRKTPRRLMINDKVEFMGLFIPKKKINLILGDRGKLETSMLKKLVEYIQEKRQAKA